MNKQEKLIVALLFLALLGWMVLQDRQAPPRPDVVPDEAANAVSGVPAPGTAPAIHGDADAPPEAPTPAPANGQQAYTGVPERTVTLANDVCRLVLTSKGGGIKAAALLRFPQTLGGTVEEPVTFAFGGHPALVFERLDGFGRAADFVLETDPDGRRAVARARRADGLAVERTMVLTNGYRVTVAERFHNGADVPLEVPAHRVTLGPMTAAMDLDDTSLAVDARITVNGQPDYPELSKAAGLGKLFGAGGGGCAAPRVAAGAPLEDGTALENVVQWAAVRTRFFVQVITPDAPSTGVRVDARRAARADGAFYLEEVRAAVETGGFTLAPGASVERAYDYYIGPRKLSRLRALGEGQARLMRFGMWRVFCEWLLDILNVLYRVVPNYGVAIILLTGLVRLALLPVTRRSAESMRRMQAMQPKLKEIQALYKDDPQKLQRETMRLYGEHKVNPLSSCLPMLIQIPIFVALFTVLRSAVELRFAPFLWVADLSAPENLWREHLGFGLNLLPILMAATMALQSYLTPTAGDATQQRMMTIMMPIMMLFMCYSFPAALGLYWTTSQVLAIFGLLWQRRKNRLAAAAANGVEVIEPLKETRQMRRARQR